MDLTLGFISQNLVAHMNFVKFRDIRNFHLFQGDGCLVDPKNGIFEKNLKMENKLSKVHIK